MNIIKTPLGEIDLDIEPIGFWIKDSSIGAKRRVVFEGISQQSEKNQNAIIEWHIWQFDEEGSLINELDAVQGRVVYTPISGYNKVTEGGMLIVREIFPEGEVGDRAYQMAMAKGINEYVYWMAMLRSVPLPMVVQAAGMLLAQYLRFDRV